MKPPEQRPLALSPGALPRCQPRQNQNRQKRADFPPFPPPFPHPAPTKPHRTPHLGAPACPFPRGTRPGNRSPGQPRRPLPLPAPPPGSVLLGFFLHVLARCMSQGGGSNGAGGGLSSSFFIWGGGGYFIFWHWENPLAARARWFGGFSVLKDRNARCLETASFFIFIFLLYFFF